METSDAQLQEKLQASSTTLQVGQVLSWRVERIEPLQIFMKPENDINNISAILHISSVIDHDDGCDELESTLESYSSLKKKQKQLEISPLHPFYEIREGQVLSGKIINIRKKKDVSSSNEDSGKETTIVSIIANLKSQGNSSMLPILQSR